ncbi:lactoylglutathione lyase [Porphyromonas gulae]|uniref:VOC family protein n=1 Tax=Porphyromonas gulae TaxID=111105 RepID=UPI00052BBBFD|nr:VOC family protein [Porphyromonas gulae]KGO03551.1 lactoylglutathione lyase [Porphyromonas gulae]
MDNQKRPFTTRFDHYNYNVLDLERSLAFYDRAFGFREVKRKEAADGSFILVYLSDESGHFLLELTWLRDRKEPYNLGENEEHLCVRTTGDYDAVREYHRAMGCICYENEQMGLYFVNDPDGYWIEVLPENRD